MLLHGRKIQGPNVEIIVLPRGSGEDIVLKAGAVMDYAPFFTLCPRPVPPMKTVKGGMQVPDLEDQFFQASLHSFAARKTAWTILTSLAYTEGLQWETVDLNNADTWENYEKELTDAGFSDQEVAHIIQKCLEANCLDQKRLDEARARFLAGPEEPASA